MSKSKKEIQREIYHFVEDIVLDTDKPVILQTILNHFCKKYSVSEPTITRILEKMVHSKNPIRLRTWYDKNRYYTIPTVSHAIIILILVSIALAIFGLYSDMFQFVPFKILERLIIFLSGFWIMFIIGHILDKKKNKN